ncbi:MAG: hypothetical protein Q4P08_03465 [Eubacteriales bacterium]|nr:hypothetical protein [Eubacteriales bacterium]
MEKQKQVLRNTSQLKPRPRLRLAAANRPRQLPEKLIRILILSSTLALTLTVFIGRFILPRDGSWQVDLTYDLVNLLLVFILPLLIVYYIYPESFSHLPLNFDHALNLVLAFFTGLALAVLSYGLNLLFLALINHSGFSFLLKYLGDRGAEVQSIYKSLPVLAVIILLIQLILPALVIALYTQSFLAKGLRSTYKSKFLASLVTALLLSLLRNHLSLFIPHFILALCLFRLAQRKRENLVEASLLLGGFYLCSKVLLPLWSLGRTLDPLAYKQIKSFADLLQILLLTLIAAAIFAALWLPLINLDSTDPLKLKQRRNQALSLHERKKTQTTVSLLLLWIFILNLLAV